MYRELSVSHIMFAIDFLCPSIHYIPARFPRFFLATKVGAKTARAARRLRAATALAELAQLLRAANSEAWCACCHANAALPMPRSTRAGSRHWQTGGLLKKRLDAAAKASEYKPQDPDPALAGAQARCSRSSTSVLATPPRASQRLGSEPPNHPRPQAAASAWLLWLLGKL